MNDTTRTGLYSVSLCMKMCVYYMYCLRWEAKNLNVHDALYRDTN